VIRKEEKVKAAQIEKYDKNNIMVKMVKIEKPNIRDKDLLTSIEAAAIPLTALTIMQSLELMEDQKEKQ
jgi:hypothetical protein